MRSLEEIRELRRVLKHNPTLLPFIGPSGALSEVFDLAESALKMIATGPDIVGPSDFIERMRAFEAQVGEDRLVELLSWAGYRASAYVGAVVKFPEAPELPQSPPAGWESCDKTYWISWAGTFWAMLKKAREGLTEPKG